MFFCFISPQSNLDAHFVTIFFTDCACFVVYWLTGCCCANFLGKKKATAVPPKKKMKKKKKRVSREQNTAHRASTACDKTPRHPSVVGLFPVLAANVMRWQLVASQEAIEDLLSLDGAAAGERAAGSNEIAAVSSSDQGTEPSWPRVFHCDLNEEAELPLLAEPRLGAEQVGGLYAGEEITAVGQQGDWLHVRLYEYEEDEDEGKDGGDHDVSVFFLFFYFLFRSWEVQQRMA